MAAGRASQEENRKPSMCRKPDVTLMSLDEFEPVVAGETPLYQQHYTCASVLVCKIMSLEEVLLLLPPQEQLVWLHGLHIRIDAILRRIPAVKVDLSGALLQFVSGTENNDKDHADTLLSLAKELLLLGNSLKLPHGQQFQVQMGMHTGECATGLVGSLALKYSVFGAAAAVAKQLESLSAPGLLRISADTKGCLKSDEKWVVGGSLTLANWNRIDTFLLGAAADSLSPADIRSAHAAVAQGSHSMTLLGSFKDQRLELPYLRLHESSLRRFDALVCSTFLLLTLLSIASLAFQKRIVLPSWVVSQPGTSRDGTPVQLVLGISFAWAAALGVVTLLPADQRPFFREHICMLLRIALSVHRVASIYLALPLCMHWLQFGHLPAGVPPPHPLHIPPGYEALAHALPVLLLSLLLSVRFQKHLLAAVACLASEVLQLSWNALQGRGAGDYISHMAIYVGAGIVIPSAVLFFWERLSRRRYMAVL